MTEEIVTNRTPLNNTLTQQQLKLILHYDAETGVFTRKWRDDVLLRFNIRDTGRMAGFYNKGHLQISINNKMYQSHRLAWLYMTGEWPEQEVDHIDLNGINNKWINLRKATPSQNQHNKSKYKNNKSGYKGVSWCKKREKWTARLRANGKNMTIGRFNNKEDAYAAYCEAALKYHGERARVV